jgi:hypothetical protein
LFQKVLAMAVLAMAVLAMAVLAMAVLAMAVLAMRCCVALGAIVGVGGLRKQMFLENQILANLGSSVDESGLDQERV